MYRCPSKLGACSGINAEELLIEDANRVGPAPFRYGYRYETNINMDTHGTWETIDNGNVIWRMYIESQDAFSIGLQYDAFDIPDGSQFYVFNENGQNIFFVTLIFVNSFIKNFFTILKEF